MNPLVIEKNGSLVAAKDLKVILRKKDFENNVCKDIDDKVYTYGFFDIASIDGKNTYSMRFPLIIVLNVVDRDSENGNVNLYYKKNDILVNSMTYFDGPKQAIAFLDLFIYGKFDMLSPDELVDAFTNNMKLNGANIGVQSELVEAMVSELLRDPKDPTIPYRLVAHKTNEPPKFLTIKDVPRVTSVFSSLAFEDVKKAIQAAIVMSRKKQTHSPVERVMS